MTALAAFVLWFLLGGVNCASNVKFPPGFKFGAATSAYQIEGAWNISDKSQSTWDTFTHTRPHGISDGSNGDVACDSYHRWQDDIDVAAKLGLHFYRFSIAWTRILPTGFADYVSEDGVRYYNNLIDGLLEKGIEPVVTMYHWDLPQRLQNLGGWTNPLIVDWFADYAKVLYTAFGDRVKTWHTINEPYIICFIGHGNDLMPPALEDTDVGVYLCSKNIVMAHAKAWRIYDKEFRKKFQGRVSIVNHLIYVSPLTKEEEETAILTTELYSGLFTHPIFSKDGGWPRNLERFVEQKSKKSGLAKSRLPAFTDEERDLAKGAFDFFAFNYYTSRKVRKMKKEEEVSMAMLAMFRVPELDAVLEVDPGWKETTCAWLFLHPEGLRKQMVWIKKMYGDVEIHITENGYPCKDCGLRDYDRIRFYKDHLEQILLAIHEDKLNVTAYTAWSLIDNFEWADGYIPRFGFFEVDFNDPKRRRIARESADYYAHVIKTNTIDIPKKYISDELS